MPIGIQYLPVKERAIQAVVNKIKTIQRMTGFNFDILSVKRYNNLPLDTPEEGTVFFYELRTRVDSQLESTHHIAEILPIEIWVHNDDVETPHLTFNLLESDIKRTLGTHVDDPTHPCPTGAQLWVDWSGSNPQYKTAGKSGKTSGIIRYNIHYRYLRTDDRLWDSIDNLVRNEE